MTQLCAWILHKELSTVIHFSFDLIALSRLCGLHGGHLGLIVLLLSK